MPTALLTLMLALCAGEAPDTLVVCPDVFRPALQPWVEYRREQGHDLRIVPAGRSATELQKEIRQVAALGKLRSVVLVGDASQPEGGTATVDDSTIPTHYVKAKINIQWGSDPEIATDNAYADLDDDLVPDIAIGRLTADTPDQLDQIVRKILAYEQSLDTGQWRRRINLVAGVGGFGALADSVLEMAAKKLLTDGIPAGFETTMTYGSWQSPYCPAPGRFHEVTLERMNEGCLFWIYIGHGRRRYLDYVHMAGYAYHILDADDVSQMHCRSGAPIALMLACYTGQFDHREDCLAEEMLRAESGPVAVVGGSRVTMPYAMAVMSTSLMDEYFQNRCETLGELLLKTKRSLVVDREDDARRQLLNTLAAALSPEADQLMDERREHLSLFNLIGDPLLRLRHPQKIELDAPNQAVAGQSIHVVGRCPLAGRCVVELAVRRDRSRVSVPDRRRFQPTNEFLASMDAAYRDVNDPVWVSRTIAEVTTNFEVEIEVPQEARGPCHVRAYLVGQGDFALGACEVFIRRPRN